jgi:hypothetical protein
VAVYSTASRKTALLVMFLAGSVGVAVWAAPQAPAPVGPVVRPAALADTLSFEVQYGGIGPEGVDLVWRARPEGAVAGLVTIRMEFAGEPADRSMPLWPVNVWLFYSADDLRSSFAAELSGTMNWRTGTMRAAGLVSDGARQDTAIELRTELAGRGMNGEARVVFYPRVAWGKAR